MSRVWDLLPRNYLGWRRNGLWNALTGIGFANPEIKDTEQNADEA